MIMLRFPTGVILLFIALALQFFLASAGISANLSFAALIAFAFVYSFWELAAFIVFAVFIVSWQPAASVEILFFALYPVAVNLGKGIVPWKTWMVAPAAIVVGYFGLALAVAPSFLLVHPFRSIIDLAMGLAFAAAIFFPLHRSTGA